MLGGKACPQNWDLERQSLSDSALGSVFLRLELQLLAACMIQENCGDALPAFTILEVPVLSGDSNLHGLLAEPPKPAQALQLNVDSMKGLLGGDCVCLPCSRESRDGFRGVRLRNFCIGGL